MPDDLRWSWCNNNRNKSKCVSHSVVSNSLQPHGLQPTRLLCPWKSPRNNTQMGSHPLFQGIWPRDWTWVSCNSLPSEPPGKPKGYRWSYLQSRNGDKDVENNHMNTKAGRGGGMNWEIGIDIYTPRVCAQSVVSNSLWPPGLYPARLLFHGILQARILEWVFLPGEFTGSPFPSPGDLPNPGVEPASLGSPALVGELFTRPHIHTPVYKIDN